VPTDDELVTQLGDDDIDVRETAETNLRRRADAAIPALAPALTSSNLERAARARRILTDQAKLSVTNEQRKAFSVSVDGTGPPGPVNIVCPPPRKRAAAKCVGEVTIDAFGSALGVQVGGSTLGVTVDLIDHTGQQFFGEDLEILLCTQQASVAIPQDAKPGSAAPFSVTFDVWCSAGMPPGGPFAGLGRCTIESCLDHSRKCADLLFRLVPLSRGGVRETGSMAFHRAPVKNAVRVCCVEPPPDRDV
jgi:hypothetical protein